MAGYELSTPSKRKSELLTGYVSEVLKELSWVCRGRKHRPYIPRTETKNGTEEESERLLRQALSGGITYVDSFHSTIGLASLNASISTVWFCGGHPTRCLTPNAHRSMINAQ